MRHIDHITEAYLLLADRYDRVRQVVQPVLVKGQWIISLRNYVSALVYQARTQIEQKLITSQFLQFEPKPDYLFWFDIDPRQAMERILSRQQQTGEPLGKFESHKYLADKRKKYQTVMHGISHVAVNAALSIDQIHQQIIRTIF